MAITFVNIKKDVITSNVFKKLKVFKVAFAKEYSYFVYNQCQRNSAIVRLLISPDGKTWMADGLEIEIRPQQLVTIVPNYYSAFSVLEYRSREHCHAAELSIWFQMTRPPAKQCFGVGNKSCR